MQYAGVAVDTPRIVIIAVFRYDGVPLIDFVIYPHVVIRAAIATTLQMEIFKVQINIVAGCYGNYPGAVKRVWIEVWVIWTREASLQVC